jgi:two-component system chemotaxis sensor kinase CheA
MLAFEDDGRGINREALAQKARQNPNLDQSLIDSFIASAEEWRILLLSGFSTAKVVTDISGRGVGLDAVAKEIASMGGTLNLESTYGQGTCILISIPI